MNLRDEHIHMVDLTIGEEADNDDKENSTARLFGNFVGPFGGLTPENELTTFTDSHDLGEDEESDPRQGLDGVIKIKLILSDVLLRSGLLLRVWWCSMLTLFSVMSVLAW